MLSLFYATIGLDAGLLQIHEAIYKSFIRSYRILKLILQSY